ncbi:MAG: universal stress protein [Pseudomonadota bacterium]|nr:universal stress protein [Pseudomonadota bacterium]
MSVGKILLPLSGRNDADATAETAFILAERFGAQVEGLHPATPPIDRFAIQDEAGAAMQYQRLLEQAKIQAKRDEDNARSRFATWSKAHKKVKTGFLALEGDAGDSVAHRARLADLTVIPKVTKKEGGFRMVVREAALFQSGRPVVIAPEKKVAAHTGETIVIAWKESVEAARAVAAALPLCGKAKAVHIVSAGSGKEAVRSLAEIKKYMALHFPKVTAKMVRGGKNVGAALLAEASKQKGPLLVMGGYSQWRWKEWVFGGVTEYVLNETGIPVLMAH